MCVYSMYINMCPGCMYVLPECVPLYISLYVCVCEVKPVFFYNPCSTETGFDFLSKAYSFNAIVRHPTVHVFVCVVGARTEIYNLWLVK